MEYTGLKPAWCCSPRCCKKELEDAKTATLNGDKDNAAYAQDILKHQRCLALSAIGFARGGFEAILTHGGGMLLVDPSLIPPELAAVIADRWRRLYQFFPIIATVNGVVISDSSVQRPQDWPDDPSLFQAIRTFILSRPQTRSTTDWQPTPETLPGLQNDIRTKLVADLDRLKAEARTSLHLPPLEAPLRSEISLEALHLLAPAGSIVKRLKTRSQWLENVALDNYGVSGGNVRSNPAWIALQFEIVDTWIRDRCQDLYKWKIDNIAPTSGTIAQEAVPAGEWQPIMSLIFSEDEGADISNSIELDD